MIILSLDDIRSREEQIALGVGNLPSTAPHQRIAISLEGLEAAARIYHQFHNAFHPSVHR